MLPTRRTLVFAFAGSLFAILPALVDVRWWSAWPVFLAWLALR